MLATRTMKAPAGPPIWKRLPPSADTIAPPMIEVNSPFSGERPEPMAIAIESGKATIAFELEKRLWDAGRAVTVLYGPDMRQGLCRDLGFTADDRSENLRRTNSKHTLPAAATAAAPPQLAADCTCRRQEFARVRLRISGAHCVDCPHWVALAPAQHEKYLAREWHGVVLDFTAHRGVFLPEDFRALRLWLHARARK